jgi:hypothetical protein
MSPTPTPTPTSTIGILNLVNFPFNPQAQQLTGQLRRFAVNPALTVTPTPTPTPGVTIREAIVSFLNSIPALTALVGKRIYFDVPSQMAAKPSVYLQVNNRDWHHNLAGADGTSTAYFEIAMQHSGPNGHGESTCIAMAEAIRNSFDGFRGMVNGVPVLSIFLSDEEDDISPPPDGSDQWIYRVIHTYRVRHRVPYPTSVTQTNV